MPNTIMKNFILEMRQPLATTWSARASACAARGARARGGGLTLVVSWNDLLRAIVERLNSQMQSAGPDVSARSGGRRSRGGPTLGVHDEATSQASEAHADQLDRETYEELVGWGFAQGKTSARLGGDGCMGRVERRARTDVERVGLVEEAREGLRGATSVSLWP